MVRRKISFTLADFRLKSRNTPCGVFFFLFDQTLCLPQPGWHCEKVQQLNSRYLCMWMPSNRRPLRLYWKRSPSNRVTKGVLTEFCSKSLRLFWMSLVFFPVSFQPCKDCYLCKILQNISSTKHFHPLGLTIGVRQHNARRNDPLYRSVKTLTSFFLAETWISIYVTSKWI